MTYTEDDILYENDIFTIVREDGVHSVLANDITHAVTVMTFDGTADGLSIAKAWIDYIVKHSSVESISKMTGIYTSTVLALRRRQAEREQKRCSANITPSDSDIATAAA